MVGDDSLEEYHSVIVGKGRPLIFLPAGGFSGLEGLNIAEALADHYECHLLDLPGMGRSEGIKGRVTLSKIAAWVKAYIERNEMEKVTLVGHSMGGGLALCFASLFPNHVEKLVLLDQGHKRIPRFPTSEFGPLGYAAPLINGLEYIWGHSFVKRIERFLLSSDGEAPEANIEKQVKVFCEKYGLKATDYIKRAFEENVEITKEGLRLMFGYYRLNLPKLLNRLSVPCLLIYASYERVDPKEAHKTKKAILRLKKRDGLSLCAINSHHYVHWADERCIEKIKEFLRGTISSSNEKAPSIH